MEDVEVLNCVMPDYHLLSEIREDVKVKQNAFAPWVKALLVHINKTDNQPDLNDA